MTSTPQPITEPGYDLMADKARDHLWMSFTRHSHYYDGSGHVPIIVRGEGAYIYDDQGKRYLDGLAGLFTNSHSSRPGRTPIRALSNSLSDWRTTRPAI
jgi:hypothetical protein